jgi:predicted dehydrogenase
MRVGLIGCGVQGDVHLDAYAQIEGVDVIAVCDLDADRRAAAAARTGARAFADYVYLLRDAPVDLVSVCTMPATHRDIVCAALAGGAHVICEKPMARTAVEAREMVVAAREGNRRLALAFNMRHMGSARVLKRAIDDGAIGRPLAIRAFMIDSTIPWWGRHHVQAANGGGVIQADAGHCLDLALWTVGYPRPLTVSGSLARAFPHRGLESAPSEEAVRSYDVEDIASAHVRLEGGAWLSLDVQWRADVREPAFGYEIVGQRGTARFDPLSLLVQRDGELLEFGDPSEADTDWPSSVHRGVAEVVAALRRGEAPPTLPEEGLIVQSITDALYASAQAGRESVLSSPRVGTDA